MSHLLAGGEGDVRRVSAIAEETDERQGTAGDGLEDDGYPSSVEMEDGVVRGGREVLGGERRWPRSPST